MPCSASLDAITRTPKPAPTRMRPKENFNGLDGSFLPSLTQSQANTGASRMMKREFSDWNQLLGKGHPSTEVRVLRSANRFRVEPACSKSDQNTAAARKNTP